VYRHYPGIAHQEEWAVDEGTSGSMTSVKMGQKKNGLRVAEGMSWQQQIAWHL